MVKMTPLLVEQRKHIALHARTSKGVLAHIFEGESEEMVKERARLWRDSATHADDFTFVLITIVEQDVTI